MSNDTQNKHEYIPIHARIQLVIIVMNEDWTAADPETW